MKSQIKITKLPKCSSKLNQWILHALHTLEEEKKQLIKVKTLIETHVESHKVKIFFYPH